MKLFRCLLALALIVLAGCAKKQTASSSAPHCEAEAGAFQHTYPSTQTLKSEELTCTVNGNSCTVIRSVSDPSIYETDCDADMSDIPTN